MLEKGTDRLITSQINEIVTNYELAEKREYGCIVITLPDGSRHLLMEHFDACLPASELRSTGPGPESGFVTSQGRRTKSGETFFDGFFSGKHVFVDRVRAMCDVFYEGMEYFRSRTGYY